MTNILILIETIYCNIFSCKYLRNETRLLNFLLRFRKLKSILNIFKKKTTAIPDVFLNLRTPKDVIR